MALCRLSGINIGVGAYCARSWSRMPWLRLCLRNRELQIACSNKDHIISLFKALSRIAVAIVAFW